MLISEYINEDDSIDEVFDKLEALVSELEGNEHSLEDTFALYETGVKLIESCGLKIDKVEKKIKVINDRGEENGL
ncbi:MAG: exodeoxyribonuclease VII small subunit [Lachnospiraceae bacterium]|nr:exodeoxyribonuclease VII small subunit [Lachnospiraceae bacterium]